MKILKIKSLKIMCLSPITIINPTKYVSLQFRDQYLLQVPCGQCADCQKQKSNEWLYRTYYEFKDCITNGNGFCLFDTLTYSSQHLPMMSEVFKVEKDYPCFNPKHIQDFMKLLRIRLSRAGYKSKLRYFLASEYGTNPRDGFTYRPHYHLLLFVANPDDNPDDKLSPLELSAIIADCWKYGRTDGIPYKDARYVLSHNTIVESNLANILRTSNYVTKYVQKSCKFQSELDRRINEVMNNYAQIYNPDNPDRWLKSLPADRIRRKLKSLTNQFHRQSLHYGESAMKEFDLEDIFESGVLIMPHHKSLKLPIVLPTYYKRKLFYRLLEIDGAKTWQLNDLGLKYKAARENKLLQDLQSRLECVCIQHRLDFDCKKLANYIMFSRGRFSAPNPPSVIEDRLEQLDLFNYVTKTDRFELGFCGLVPKWLGNSSLGYLEDFPVPFIRIKDFIKKYVFVDEGLEKQLSEIYYYCSFVDKGKQDAYELRQRLTNIYKCFL